MKLILKWGLASFAFLIIAAILGIVFDKMHISAALRMVTFLIVGVPLTFFLYLTTKEYFGLPVFKGNQGIRKILPSLPYIFCAIYISMAIILAFRLNLV